MKVLFICPYPHDAAGSQRFRFEQYFAALSAKGISYRQSPFIDAATWRILYKPGYFWLKLWGILKGYFTRLKDIFTIQQYDFVFIHREAAPLGPPLFEWLITKVFKKKVIFDFDDAIWIPNASEQNSSIVFKLKWYSNTLKTCKWAYRVSAGNHYLCDFARQYNHNVIFNPTTIDTDKYLAAPQVKLDSIFTIGWTGSHSTVQYLNELYPVFLKLEKEFNFKLLVTSDKKPEFELKSLEYRHWSKENELTDLQAMTIGIMPIPNDKWAKGKCGFKALQYLALGIPALVSPIGVNTNIIQHGENGFHCCNLEDWEHYIRLCMKEPETVKHFNTHASKIVNKQYSVKANTVNFLSLFQ